MVQPWPWPYELTRAPTAAADGSSNSQLGNARPRWLATPPVALHFTSDAGAYLTTTPPA
jgi:hypothetical protein